MFVRDARTHVRKKKNEGNQKNKLMHEFKILLVYKYTYVTV